MPFDQAIFFHNFLSILPLSEKFHVEFHSNHPNILWRQKYWKFFHCFYLEIGTNILFARSAVWISCVLFIGLCVCVCWWCIHVCLRNQPNPINGSVFSFVLILWYFDQNGKCFIGTRCFYDFDFLWVYFCVV